MRRSLALCYAAPVFLAVGACQTWFEAGKYIATGDLPPFIAVGLEGEHGWLWNHLATGAGSPSSQIALAPQVWFIRLVEAFGASDVLGQRLFYSCLFGLVAFAGTYFARSFSVAPAAGAAGGLICAFNPFHMTQLPNPLPLLTVVVMGVMGGLVLRAASGRNVSPLAFSGVSIAASYLSVNPPLLAVTAVWLLLITVLASALVGAGGTARACRFLTRAAPWALLLNLWWLVPLGFMLLGSSAPGVDLVAETDVRSWAWTHVRNSLANVTSLNATWAWNQGDYFPYAATLDRSPWQELRFLLPVVAFATPFLAKNEARVAAATMALLAMGLIFLSKGLHPPLAGVNLWLYDSIPGLWLLREPFAKLAPMIVVLYCGLVAIGVDTLITHLRTLDSRWRHSAAVGSFTAVAAIAIYPLPLWNGTVIADREDSPLSSAHVAVPDAWRQAAELINSSPPRGKALVLPLDDYYQMPTTWGFYGTDYTARLLIRRPVIQLLPGSYLGEPPGYVELVRLIEDSLATQQPSRIPEMLIRLGVSHVVLRHDLVTGMEGRTFKAPSDLEPTLHVVPGIRLVRSFGLVDVFEITGAKSQILRTDGLVPGSVGPRIEWRRINPARYAVEVQNADRPFLLVLNESFAPGWNLRGVPAGRARHLLVDGYANGWRLPAGDQLSLIAEYTPALKARRALQISQISVLAAGSLVGWRAIELLRKRRWPRHGEE